MPPRSRRVVESSDGSVSSSESDSNPVSPPVPSKRAHNNQSRSSGGSGTRGSKKARTSATTDSHSEAEEEQGENAIVEPEDQRDQDKQYASGDESEQEEPAPPSAQSISSSHPKSPIVKPSASQKPATPIRTASLAPKSPSPTKQRVRHASTVPLAEKKPEPNKPRLTIHKIVLINFKSYAGIVNIGPFHPSFSAIVGPNGSGKSNTIDALLFVFGFKASKMRQAKLSELIHNSDQHQDLDFCSVEVHFREILDLDTPVPQGQPPLFDPVPGTELVVARTAYRNNTNKYTIDGRTSNYKEVTTMLKDKGIDLDHKRFLILQGEVESIALMKPKGATEHEDGLLEYLEDIIGTDRFKEPLEQANKEVEEYNDQRSHALNRVKVVEHEKAVLEVSHSLLKVSIYECS